ncbi:bifunctional UDP-N-acetylglucosamine diphosphorylase/glucosamine-1-phosphate N-acetyltransferase GlmU [Wenzhouxiangella sp. XN24]|uniref:bifunctional UDP-N-acetylglucosamine diphosphorylase/glucosamine-1-phosphate N-acetyltransferase GlmU n=1 Tax=Wenzhouxiangella sp. XN24 TaxID=2713569 RepID=UPI00197E0FE7|nr:bifunctional UDP-N-acetylglucosamine diphosphorylase/glucosamine-1-phosphate N-acetyltransferase GlmU [Wenzhouxiangella sp. XN24]
MALHVVILAAGQGTRMKSALPKVLQPLAGRPLLAHVLGRALGLGAHATHVVYGHGGDAVPQAFPEADVRWVLQAERLGTGHAVAQAMPGIPDDAVVLVLYGDVPLIEASTLKPLVTAAREGKLALLGVKLDDPTGYGRIVRDAGGKVVRIVEEKDASAAERAVAEVNTGIMAAPAGRLRAWLGGLSNRNAQGEYYLTDVVGLAVAEGMTVEALQAPTVAEVLGINDRAQLAGLETTLRRRIAADLMTAGVTLADPARIDVRGRVDAGRDVFIDINAVFEGVVELGDNVSIGPNVFIRDSRLGPGCVVQPNTVIEGADVGPGCELGPFARFRPGAELADGVRVGNFVEIKNSRIGPASKVNHLSYIGDAEIGTRVNVGAGTITCNYDGANKHRTVIGDDVFVGSNTALVAPVNIGAGATIGAGSTVSKDAPPAELTVARSKQVTVRGWKRPVKKPG